MEYSLGDLTFAMALVIFVGSIGIGLEGLSSKLKIFAVFNSLFKLQKLPNLIHSCI